MKNLYLTVAAFTGFAITLAACSQNEQVTDEVQGQPATLTVSIQGGNSDASVRSTGVVTNTDENTVSSFSVYVYNQPSNILEKKQDFTSVLIGTVTGLTTGDKKIVVVANAPAAYASLAANTYSALNTNMFDLDTQTTSNNLAMSGETTTTLGTSTNTVSVNISRVVAKVQLGTVTISPNPGNTGTLVLNKVYIMRAKSTSNMGTPTIATGSSFYGGMTGTTSTTVQTFLSENYAPLEPTTNPAYFYVFPNDNTGNNSTLITLEGTYDGTTTYYPFVINDGTYISRNTYYTINVTLKETGSGSSDPEAPVSPATLDITVVPQNWIVAPVINVTW